MLRSCGLKIYQHEIDYCLPQSTSYLVLAFVSSSLNLDATFGQAFIPRSATSASFPQPAFQGTVKFSPSPSVLFSFRGLPRGKTSIYFDQLDKLYDLSLCSKRCFQAAQSTDGRFSLPAVIINVKVSKAKVSSHSTPKRSYALAYDRVEASLNSELEPISRIPSAVVLSLNARLRCTRGWLLSLWSNIIYQVREILVAPREKKVIMYASPTARSLLELSALMAMCSLISTLRIRANIFLWMISENLHSLALRNVRIFEDDISIAAYQ